jgi:hypothetical protein
MKQRTAMIKKNFMIEKTVADELRAIHERDGIPEAETVRRALRAWLDSRSTAEQVPRRIARRRS